MILRIRPLPDGVTSQINHAYRLVCLGLLGSMLIVVGALAFGIA